MKVKSSKPKSNNNYVDKEQLYNEFKVYHAAKKAGKNPHISDFIGKCILLICNNLSLRPNFNGYTYRSEMISDGVEDCIAAVKNFDPKKSKNPYGYFTQIAWWAFVQRILIEKKQQYLKHKNYQNNFMLNDLANTDNDTIEKLQWSALSDQVIEGFEKNLTKNKKTDTIPNIVKYKSKDTYNVQSKKNSSGTRNRSVPRKSFA